MLTSFAGNVPFFLDDSALSQMASSACDGMQQVIEEQEDSPRREEELEIQMTRSTGRMARARPLGPIRSRFTISMLNTSCCQRWTNFFPTLSTPGY